MACLVLKSPNSIRVIHPSADGQFRYSKLPNEELIRVDDFCSPDPKDDLSSLVTSEGVMIGNLIKKVTSAVGIKQCLSCKGRQHRYNLAGLAIQRKIKELF